MTVDLKTKYLGLELTNPLVVAACPLTRESTKLEMLEQAGAAAAVMYSLFAEQVESDQLGKLGKTNGSETGESDPNLLPHEYVSGLDEYLKNIEVARKSVSIPIIGSLNGSGMGDWIRFAKLIEQAGADALELNLYFVPTDPHVSGADVENEYLEIVAAVRDLITIPLAIKLGPFFSSLPNFAVRLADLGVNGLVLFNRFLQPDVDPDSFAVTPRLKLSTRSELLLPLRWIAILRTHLDISLGASTGAHTAEDVEKLLLSGADVVCLASALLRNGPDYLTTILNDLREYLEAKSFQSLEDVRGLVNLREPSNSDVFERANYIRTICSYDED